MSIVLEHVSYTYSPETAYEIHALKDVNLEIPDGLYVYLLGTPVLENPRWSSI